MPKFAMTTALELQHWSRTIAEERAEDIPVPGSTADSDSDDCLDSRTQDADLNAGLDSTKD